MDLPREIAFWASTAALCLQVARRLSRLDFDVFFLGTAMTADIVILNNLPILRDKIHIRHYRNKGTLNWEEILGNFFRSST